MFILLYPKFWCSLASIWSFEVPEPDPDAWFPFSSPCQWCCSACWAAKSGNWEGKNGESIFSCSGRLMISFCRALIAGIMVLASEFIGHHAIMVPENQEWVGSCRVLWVHWSWWSVSMNPYSGPNKCLHSKDELNRNSWCCCPFSLKLWVCGSHYLMNRLFYIRISPFLRLYPLGGSLVVVEFLYGWTKKKLYILISDPSVRRSRRVKSIQVILVVLRLVWRGR